MTNDHATRTTDAGCEPAARAGDGRREGYAAPELLPVGTLGLMLGNKGNDYDDRVFCRYYR